MHVIYHLGNTRSKETVEDLRRLWGFEEDRRNPGAKLTQLTYQRYEVIRGSGRELAQTIRKCQARTSIVVLDFKTMEDSIGGIWDALCERQAHEVRIYCLRPYLVLDARSEETSVWLPIVKKIRQQKLSELTKTAKKPKLEEHQPKVREKIKGKPLSYQLQEKIIDGYLNHGSKVKEIALALDVSEASVNRYIKKYREGIRHRRPYARDDKAHLKEIWAIPEEDIRALKIIKNSSLADAVRSYLHTLNTEKTARICYGCLDKFFRWLADRHVRVIGNAGEIKPSDGSDYYRILSGQYKQSTCALHMGQIKSFLKYCLEMKFTDKNPFSAIKVKSYKYDTVRADPLTREEIRRIVDYLEDKTQKSIEDDEYLLSLRDELLIKFFLYSGLRVSSVINIRIGDITFSDNSMKVIVSLKGGREASVKLNKTMRDLTKRFLKTFTKEDEPDPRIFLFFKDMDALIEPISYEKVRSICARVGTAASVISQLTTHRFRATFATLLWEDGVDLLEIKSRLNHSNMNQLSQYVKPSLEPNDPSYMKRKAQ